MDFLQTVFLESPAWLGAFSFVLFAAVLFARRRMEETAAKAAIPATLALIVLLFVVQASVTTQRERLFLRMEALVSALERVDVAGISDALSVRFTGRSGTRDEAVARIESFFTANRVWDTRLRGGRATVSGDTAEMFVGATATVSRDSGPGERHWGRWRIAWSREPDAWRITTIETLMIDALPAETLTRLAPHHP